jgi:tRNA(Ile)-lysidine synthase
VRELPKKVEESIRARRLLARGQRLLVAVSGGLDSVVLLHVLHGLGAKHGWQLTVAHLNHRLRGAASEADERLVRRTAKRLGLPIRVERADVRRFARSHRLSLEMAARRLRHEFLARTAAQLGISSIALAHHADDQVELFFLRLLRGASGEGLAGMKWRSPSPVDKGIEILRPLLEQSKSALRSYAACAGISFREDATNACLDIQRNRIRHELLPLLRAHYQPALSKIILRVADIAGAEAEFAVEAAKEWLRVRQQAAKNGRRGGPRPKDRARTPGGPACGSTFEKLPIAVQRRVIQLQLLRRGITVDYHHVEQLRSAADKSVGISPAQPPGDNPRSSPSFESHDDTSPGKAFGAATAIRDRSGILRIQILKSRAVSSESLGFALDAGAGSIEFAGASVRWRIHRKRGSERPEARRGCEYFDADKVGSPIVLRHWCPGDRFQPIGMAQSVKLQDLFTNLKVPRGLRPALIVATTAAGELFWVEGVRISERFKLSNNTIRRLQWRWKRP